MTFDPDEYLNNQPQSNTQQSSTDTSNFDPDAYLAGSSLPSSQEKTLGGFLSNAASDVTTGVRGLGNLAEGLVTSPINTVGTIAKNVIPATWEEYKDLIEHPIEHGYSHPVNSLLDILPAIDLGTGLVSEAGDIAGEAAGKIVNPSLQNIANRSAADILGTEGKNAEAAGDILKNAEASKSHFFSPSTPTAEDLMNSTKSTQGEMLRGLQIGTNDLPIDLQPEKINALQQINNLKSLAQSRDAQAIANTSIYRSYLNELNNLTDTNGTTTIGKLADMRDNLKAAGWNIAGEHPLKNQLYEGLRNKINERFASLSPEDFRPNVAVPNPAKKPLTNDIDVLPRGTQISAKNVYKDTTGKSAFTYIGNQPTEREGKSFSFPLFNTTEQIHDPLTGHIIPKNSTLSADTIENLGYDIKPELQAKVQEYNTMSGTINVQGEIPANAPRVINGIQNYANRYRGTQDIEKQLAEKQRLEQGPLTIGGLEEGLLRGPVLGKIGGITGLFTGPGGFIGKIIAGYGGKYIGDILQTAGTRFLLRHPNLTSMSPGVAGKILDTSPILQAEFTRELHNAEVEDNLTRKYGGNQ